LHQTLLEMLQIILQYCAIHRNLCDAPPSSLYDPKRVQRVGFVELVRNLVPLPTSNTKRGRRVMLEAPGFD
jgi:hypothetical protein